MLSTAKEIKLRFKDEFLYPTECTYLNFNSLGFPLIRVRKKLFEYKEIQDQYRINPKRALKKLSQKVNITRQSVSRFINTPTIDGIIFTQNISSAMETIIRDFSSDDEIVTTDCEYDAIIHPKKGIFKFHKNIIFARIFDATSEDDVSDRIVNTISNKTKLLFFSSITYNFGIHLPARKIINRCKKLYPNLKIFIDGAQALGHVNIDMRDLDGCDFYGTNGYKWLCGPIGTGILIINEENLISAGRHFCGDSFSISHRLIGKVMKSISGSPAIKFKGFGPSDRTNPNVPAIVALDEAIGLVEEIGMKTIEFQNKKLASHFKKKLEEVDIPGLRILSPKSKELTSGIVTINVEGKSHSFLSNALLKHGINCRPIVSRKWKGKDAYEIPEGLRFCFHCISCAEQDIDRVVEKLKLSI